MQQIRKLERSRPVHRARGVARRIHRERVGQATVEYVGLAVAVAVLLVSIGGGLGSHGDKLGDAMAKRLTQAIRTAS